MDGPEARSAGDAKDQSRDGDGGANPVQPSRPSIPASQTRQPRGRERSLPAEAIAVDVPPERHRMLRPFASERRHRPSTSFRRPTEDSSGGAVNFASQQIHYAAQMGFNIGAFMLGELGYTPSSKRIGHDPSQITSSRGEGCSDEWVKRTKLVRSQSHIASRPHGIHINEPSLRGTGPSRLQDIALSRVSEEGTEPDPSLSVQQSGLSQPQSPGGSESGSETSEDTDPKPSEREDSTSSVSGDIVVKGEGHYDPNNDVILRLEAMSPTEVRALNLFLWSWLLAAAIVLGWQFIGKLVDHDAAVRTKNYVIVNIVVGSFCLICTTIALGYHGWLIKRSLWRVWTPRRTKTTALIAFNLFVQWLNLLLFVLPNYLVIGKRCALSMPVLIIWFAGARWTCWNTLFLIALIQAHNSNISAHYQRRNKRSPGFGRTNLKVEHDSSEVTPTVVADLPFWAMHWWKFIIWLSMECSVIALVALCLTLYYRRVTPIQFCPDSQSDGECSLGTGTVITSSVMVAFAVLYFLLYCFFLRRGLRQLSDHSNVEFKLANTSVRIQVKEGISMQLRLRLPAFMGFILSVLILWFVKPFSCDSVETTWLGMLPGQIINTAVTIALSYISSPKRCIGKGRPPVLQVWLQEYAWLKAEKAEKVAKRNASMAPEDRAQIEKEPMFCVEAMLICLYWSALIYDFEELIWEKSLDTKCLIAWSRKEIILVFRGTASLTNLVADVQAWRSHHMPKRGSFWKRPMVHSGFDKAWRNNGLNEKVLGKIKQLFVNHEVDHEDYRVYITGANVRDKESNSMNAIFPIGHSLGGALAALAAYDLRSMGKQRGHDKSVTVITFGSPRVGNHAFASDFNAVVPDCWNVINDQDLVAKSGKLIFAYKRGGHRVIINKMGDLLVRPNPLEASLRVLTFRGSVRQHLLTSYLDSILAVMMSRFSKSKAHGPMARIVKIVKHNKPLEKLILEQVGLTVKDLEHMSRWGGYAPLIAQKHDEAGTLNKLSSITSFGRHTDCFDSCGYCDTISLWMEDVGDRLSPYCCCNCSVPSTKDGSPISSPRQ